MNESARTVTGIENALRLTRLFATALAVSVLGLTTVSGLLPLGKIPSLVVLAPPAALLGLVSPVIGYRLYLWQRDRRSESSDRCAAYLRAVIVALAITEGIALLGIVIYLSTGRSFPLVGVLTHILLTGAIWPTREKIESWIEDP